MIKYEHCGLKYFDIVPKLHTDESTDIYSTNNMVVELQADAFILLRHPFDSEEARILNKNISLLTAQLAE